MTERVETFSDYNFTGCEFKLGGPTSAGSCALMENMYARNGDLHMRPQYDGTTSAVDTYTQCIGSWYSSADTVRRSYELRKGQIYSGTGVNGAHTLYVSTANLTTAGITLSTTDARVHSVEYNGEVVFNDGINQPFMWDGAAGAGGLTLLSNAPATCVGKPTVYYGKLFFIKSGHTIVWSEENAANTGYEAGGYNNTWALSQTSTAQVYAIEGTNEGLWYFRDVSIGLIEGTVTPDFSTTGVDDAVSKNVGTTATEGHCYVDGKMFFVDNAHRPHVIVGRTVVPLYQQMSLPWEIRSPLPWLSGRVAGQLLARGWAQTSSTNSYVVTVLNKDTRHVMFWVPAFGHKDTSPQFDDAAVFDIDTLKFQGFWTTKGASRNAITHIATCDSRPTPVLFGLTGIARWGYMRTQWYGPEQDKLFSADESYYYRRVIGPKQSWTPGQWDVAVDRVDVAISTPHSTGSDQVRLDMQIRNPSTFNDLLATQPTSTAVDSYMNSAVSGEATEKRVVFGPPSNEGRWACLDILFSYRDADGTEIGGGGGTDPSISRIFGYDMSAFVYPINPSAS